MNDLGWELDTRATVYVPYTRLSEATQVFLASPQTTPCPVVLVDVSRDDWAYQDYMEQVWAKGEDFINFEHDIVPWPGAIQELLECDRPWCFFGYQDQVKDLASCSAAMFGLVRFRSVMMRALPDVWAQRRAKGATEDRLPWRGLDIHLFNYATARYWPPHQHYPSILNANTRILNQHHGISLPRHRRIKASELGGDACDNPSALSEMRQQVPDPIDQRDRDVLVLPGARPDEAEPGPEPQDCQPGCSRGART